MYTFLVKGGGQSVQRLIAAIASVQDFMFDACSSHLPVRSVLVGLGFVVLEGIPSDRRVEFVNYLLEKAEGL